ncbi:MAG: ABC transporter permease [Candidatus Saccharimonadales bacterium]
MQVIHDIRLLYRRSFLQTLRNMIWVVVGISTPILYLILFTPLLKKLAGGPAFATGQVLDIFLPGILALMAFSGGIAQGFSTIFELQSGLIERLRVTPASRLALLISPILSALTFNTVFMIMIVAIGVPLGFHLHLAGLVVAFILLCLLSSAFAAFSIALALLTKEISSFAAPINGINLPLLLLAGVLLPITLAPEWMKVLAHFNPLYYAVEGARALSSGVFSSAAVWQAFAVMVPLTIFVLWWATRVYRKAVA